MTDLTDPTSTDTASPRARPVKPRVKFEGSATTAHRVVQGEGALAEVFGTDDPVLVEALVHQCVMTLQPSEAGDSFANEDQRAFMVSIVNDLAPRDAVERMLAVQMASVHVALLREGRAAAHANDLRRLEVRSGTYNKLARTFVAQVEALQKHRRGGRQTVVVQHVTVEEGGQAIVGHIEAGARDPDGGVGVR